MACSFASDSDMATDWATQYTSKEIPKWIQLDFDRPAMLYAMKYANRKKSRDRTKELKLEFFRRVESTLTPVLEKKIILEDNANLQKFIFDAVQADRVKITLTAYYFQFNNGAREIVFEAINQATTLGSSTHLGGSVVEHQKTTDATKESCEKKCGATLRHTYASALVAYWCV